MKWIINLQTSVKLISSFLIIGIIMTFVGFYGLNNLGRMNSSLDDMYANQLNAVAPLLRAQATFNNMRSEMRKMYMTGDQQQRQQIAEAQRAEKTVVTDYINEFRKTELAPESQAALPLLLEGIEQYLQYYDKGLELGLASRMDELEAMIDGELGEYSTKVREALNKLVDINLNEAYEANAAAEALYSSSRMITIVVVVAAVIVSILFGYFISRMITVPLNRVVGLVSKVAEGDLRETVNYDAKDEIGTLSKAIDTMVLQLRQTVDKIFSGAESVSAASEQISASTEEIASGSTSQAQAAQTMNELFRELSEAIGSVARNAEQAADLSNRTTAIAEDGGKVVRASIEGMTLVNDQMSRLEQDSNQIGEIIEVIDDIAEQTNLLALNAAIEAARAGDQGRGFAVVADEVRKLAERSGEATKQITAIIKGMQENTKQSVKAVAEGVLSSQKTGEAFEKITGIVNESAGKVGEIAAASEEQAAQSSEVMASIESISAATEEAAASSEETASTAQSLAQLAEELNRSVSIFRVR